VNPGKVGVVVAARMSSTRLPGKAMLPLQGIPMVAFLLRRLAALKSGQVVLATTRLAVDDELAELARAEGVDVFRGPDADVVGRYVAAADRYGFDTVARVTADCPFVDAELVDWCLSRTAEFERCDLATTKTRFPVGLDVEIYAVERMRALNARELTEAEREHLTLYYYEHDDEFAVRTIEPPVAWPRPDRRFTVDTQADYEEAVRFADLFDDPRFTILSFLERVDRQRARDPA
jgi:spore coat polysaccharide biosynthesis protein SpsF